MRLATPLSPSCDPLQELSLRNACVHWMYCGGASPNQIDSADQISDTEARVPPGPWACALTYAAANCAQLCRPAPPAAGQAINVVDCTNCSCFK